MAQLVDKTIIAAIAKKSELGHVHASTLALNYVNSASAHITATQWSTTGSWTEYDLSSHIGALSGIDGLVLISGKARGTGAGDNLDVRSSIGTQTYAAQTWISQVANVISAWNRLIHFNDGKIDYFRSNNINYLQLTMLWWIEL